METKEKKPIFKKWWFWVIIVVLLIGIISAAGGSKDKPAEPSNNNSNQTSADTENDAKATNKEETKTAYDLGDGNVRVWQNSIGTNWISVSLPVKNTGSDTLYLSSGTFDIEDASGKLVTTLRMVNVYPQVLLPGETAYYYEENTLDEAVSQDGLKIVPHIEVVKAKIDCIRYDITEVSVKDEAYGGVKVTGRVENTSDEPEDMIYVVANLFDANGDLIAQQFTILTDTLQPGEKIGFETSNLGYDFSASDVADYAVYAFPTQIQF